MNMWGVHGRKVAVVKDSAVTRVCAPPFAANNAVYPLYDPGVHRFARAGVRTAVRHQQSPALWRGARVERAVRHVSASDCAPCLSAHRARRQPPPARATTVRLGRPHFAHATRCSTHPALVTAQHRACGSDNMAAIALTEEDTALLRALVRTDDPEMRALMESAGANIAAMNSDGTTVLLEAARSGRYADLASLILGAGTRMEPISFAAEAASWHDCWPRAQRVMLARRAVPRRCTSLVHSATRRACACC
ncbi:hypothetical protein EON67_02795 [archaeon]|nr:MAG: hypothetical protein EON67_02795 [archaeon]